MAKDGSSAAACRGTRDARRVPRMRSTWGERLRDT